MRVYSYTTLQAVRQQARVDTTTDDEDFADLIPVISYLVTQWTGDEYIPVIDTRGFNGEVGLTNPTLYLKGHKLLAATAITNGDGTAVATYTLLPRYSYPKDSIRLPVGSYWTAPNTYGECYTDVALDAAYAEDALTVTGIWGVHEDYTNAWQDSTANLGAAITTTTTPTITLDKAGQIDVGHIIQIDSEWLLVEGPIAATAQSLTLTVKRGINGSTAATHLSGADIYVWQVDPGIELATRMWVAAAQQAKQNATGEALSVSGVVSNTSDMPKKVKMKLQQYWNFQRGEAFDL